MSPPTDYRGPATTDSQHQETPSSPEPTRHHFHARKASPGGIWSWYQGRENDHCGHDDRVYAQIVQARTELNAVSIWTSYESLDSRSQKDRPSTS